MMAKKNALLKNKRMITYTLLGMLVMAAPALLGFLDYDFMPWGYIASAVAYLIAGFFNDRWLLWVFKKTRDEDAKDEKERLKYRTRIIYTSIQIVLGMLMFAVLFNVCNELKYGIWAATALLPFALPSILRRSYDIFIHIQPLVYKIWNYGSCAGYATPEDIDHSKLKVVLFEVFKNEGDAEPILLNIKVPEELMFGDWVKLLFEDYNIKNPHAPIDVFDKEESGWIFYVKPWFLAPRRYLDYEQTVAQNRIRERHLIVAKRVKNITITE
jgi:putative flippase GtrA